MQLRSDELARFAPGSLFCETVRVNPYQQSLVGAKMASELDFRFLD